MNDHSQQGNPGDNWALTDGGQSHTDKRFLTYEDLAELFGYDGKMVNWRQFINASREEYCEKLRRCRIKVGRRAVFPKGIVEEIIRDLGA